MLQFSCEHSFSASSLAGCLPFHRTGDNLNYTILSPASKDRCAMFRIILLYPVFLYLPAISSRILQTFFFSNMQGSLESWLQECCTFIHFSFTKQSFTKLVWLRVIFNYPFMKISFHLWMIPKFGVGNGRQGTAIVYSDENVGCFNTPAWVLLLTVARRSQSSVDIPVSGLAACISPLV